MTIDFYPEHGNHRRFIAYYEFVCTEIQSKLLCGKMNTNPARVKAPLATLSWAPLTPATTITFLGISIVATASILRTLKWFLPPILGTPLADDLREVATILSCWLNVFTSAAVVFGTGTIRSCFDLVFFEESSAAFGG